MNIDEEWYSPTVDAYHGNTRKIETNTARDDSIRWR